MLLLTKRRTTSDRGWAGVRGMQEEREIAEEKESETSCRACAVFGLFIIIQNKSCWWYCTYHLAFSTSTACNPASPPAHPPILQSNSLLICGPLMLLFHKEMHPLALVSTSGGELIVKQTVCLSQTLCRCKHTHTVSSAYMNI